MGQPIQNQHRLLKRQLQKYPNTSAIESEAWDAFTKVINETYFQVDRERRLLENALEVTSQELTGANSQLSLLIENAPTGIAMLDSQLRYLYASRRWLEDRQLRGVDVIGKSHYEIFPLLPERWKEAHQRGLLGEITSCDEDKITLADGSFSWVRWEVRPWLNSDGSIGGLIIYSEDISDRKTAEEELRIASVAFQSKDGMLVTDAQGKILRINEAFEKVTGYEAKELVGKNTSVFRSTDHQDDVFYRNMWEAITSEGKWEGSIWNRKKDGQVFPVWLSISAVRGLNEAITHYIGIYSNTSDPREAERKIMELAYYDPLTNLPNRRLLLERLNQARIVATQKQVFGAIILIDVDRFKSINDTRGHEMGDQVLMAVAQTLRGNLREMDTAARLGGDEFIMLIPDLGSDPDEAMNSIKATADKLHASISEPMHLNGITHTTTSSIGITLFSHKTQGSSDLLKEAAFALYQAKAAGRNAIRYFDDEMHTQYTKKSNLEAKLRRALDEEELSLVYQPQVDQSGKIIGAEALLRWDSEGVSATSPDVFIPIAEEGGFIIPIGEWVLQKACSLLALWAKSECTSKLVLSVNISAKQFKLPNFVEVVELIIKSTGANPNLLKLELTESLLLEDLDVVISTMNDLKKIGVKFSIDDFGTGYSSLSYVKRLPIDEIKIDKSFVHDVSWDEGDRAIIRSILSLAHSLNLRVVAEGVETLEQRDYLYSEGCFFYQGYFYGRPLTEENFHLMVRSLA